MSKILNIKCPNCQAVLQLAQPDNPGVYKFTCNHCQKDFKIKIQEKDIHLAGQPSGTAGQNSQPPTEPLGHRPTDPLSHDGLSGHLVRLKQGLLGKNVSYTLRPGKNIVGRADETYPSDISIDKDDTVSRRSVEIDVLPNEKGGYRYKLSILKATNPVYVNGSPMQVGEALYLNYGDTLQLGRTVFKFEKNQ